MPPQGQVAVSAPTATKIVIADDHPLFRDALRRILSAQRDFEVVAEASDGKEALEFCREYQPEVVLMDLHMPTMGGIEATQAIKRELPQVIVLVLTAFEDAYYLAEALRAGAAGYLLKHAHADELVKAIRAVLSGESPIDPQLGAQLLLRLHQQQQDQERAVKPSPTGSPRQARPEQELLDSLSPRELEVLRLIARGQTNHQIAQNLFISIYTVKKHVRRVITKLGASDRTQAALLAIELGVSFINGGA